MKSPTAGLTLRLTPSGHLRADLEGDGDPGARWLAEAFAGDWRQGLFTLAAQKIDMVSAPTVRFWREVGDRYLARLCHLPGQASPAQVADLSAGELATLLLTAPPMPGGEYLTEAALREIWAALTAWTLEMAGGGLDALLAERAPKWRQVGRVCFHLAENKADAQRPFAFMATWAADFGAGGRVRHVPLGKALQRYSGQGNRPALIKLLTPVHQAAERCDWVRELVDSRRIYQPMAWQPSEAFRMLRSVPVLEDAGLSVRLPNWWRRRARPRVSVTIGENRPKLGVSAMLDFDVRVALGDESLTAAELERLLQSGDPLVLVRGQWVEVDRQRLQQAIDHWSALKAAAGDGRVSFVEGMRLLAGASIDLAHEEEVDELQDWAQVVAGAALRDLLAGLRDPAALGGASAPAGLRATLRPYQRDGVQWLHLVTGLGLGACLADDMGLGKTIQVLAHLQALRESADSDGYGPSLLVAPASLLGNWRREAARFTPSLRLVVAHSSETDQATLARLAEATDEALAGVDLVVTTYGMASRRPWIRNVRWLRVILDEAQAIKNPGTRQSKAVRKLEAGARIALTGTPIENRLGDLWALFDFLNPGLLGSAPVFRDFVKRLESHRTARYAPLRRLVAPYILRRLKTDPKVVPDLPDKIETTAWCALTPAQVRLYEQVVRGLEETLTRSEGMARRGAVLQALMRLKQVCNHPDQLTGHGGYAPTDSGKLVRLTELCEEIAARQERVLVFTQFKEVIAPLATHLAGLFGRPGLVLHGGTPVRSRPALVERFQDEDGPPFFVLSLKAGGTGLTLTAASHVIHFDRWWNPAVESQATDRAFRIGQHRNVLVHKFVTRGTVEERIDAIIEGKRALSVEILGAGQELKLTELSDSAILDLVRLDVRAFPE